MKHLTEIKSLSRTLLLSGILNVVLIITLFYFLIKETPPKPYFELKPATKMEQIAPLALDSSNKELLLKMRLQPMEQLIPRLSKTDLVQDGYTERDITLAALIAFHHFDLNRALSGKEEQLQQRKIVLGKSAKGQIVEVKAFPGITEEQFQTIQNFAQTERWPVTSKGLFLLLRKQKNIDPLLEEAFFLTPEFIATETLFLRSNAKLQKKELLTLLLEGNWKMIQTFYDQQKVIQDLSPARRQRFLLDYIERNSTLAADILIRTDGVFAATKLDDAHILKILTLLNTKTPQAEKFAVTLLASPRGNAVLQAAAIKLYEFSGEQLPEKEIYRNALKRFIAKSELKKKVIAAKKNQTIASVKTKTYIIQDGDSLWKISKKFKVDIDKIKKHNKLKTDVLKPGTTLEIP